MKLKKNSKFMKLMMLRNHYLGMAVSLRLQLLTVVLLCETIKKEKICHLKFAFIHDYIILYIKKIKMKCTTRQSNKFLASLDLVLCVDCKTVKFNRKYIDLTEKNKACQDISIVSSFIKWQICPKILS